MTNLEFLGLGGVANKSASIVGVASTFGGAVLAMAVSPDTLPVLGAAMGVGVGIAWAIVNSNRDRAREALLKEMEMLQRILDQREADIEEVRKAKILADKLNSVLEVRISRLEEESSFNLKAMPPPP